MKFMFLTVVVRYDIPDLLLTWLNQISIDFVLLSNDSVNLMVKAIFLVIFLNIIITSKIVITRSYYIKLSNIHLFI